MNFYNLIAAPIDWFINDFFYWTLNASISASFLVLAIILLRFIFKKAPKALLVALWGLVAIRLVCPFSLESALSLVPSAETIPNESIFSEETQHDNFTMDFVTNPNYPETITHEFETPVSSVGIDLLQLEFLWLIGIAAMLLYTIISYVLIYRKTKPSILLKDNIYICDNIETPFILGVIKPKIYIPSYMNEEDMKFVIAHEKAHLKRKDQLWKPLGFVLLSLYWINPVMWIAYILLCRDIELACDEKVIKEMGVDIKKPYSQALINCSVPRKAIAACPLAFGEVGVKDRIKSVLNYKKPAFWVIVTAVLASAVVAVCFMTDPLKNDTDRNYYVLTQESSATIDGIGLEITDILTTGDKPYLNVRWINTTETDATFGEEFYIYRYVNGEWKDCRTTDNYYYTLEAFLLPKSNYVFKEYSLSNIEFPKEGLYRFKSKCNIDGKEEKVLVDFELTEQAYNSLETTVKYDKNTADTLTSDSHTTESFNTEPVSKEQESAQGTTALNAETTTEKQPSVQKVYPKTAVAFTGSRTLSGGLNTDKMAISSIQHLPIYKFESRIEVERFIAQNGDKITLDSGWDEVPSVNTVLEQYDEAFFEENVLFAVFVQCSDCTHRFVIDSVYNNGTNFVIHVKQANHPQMVAEMVAGWMLTYTAKREEVKTCTQFDADLNNGIPLVTSIEDLTVKQQLATDSALQPFFEDNEYVYSYPSIRSDYVIVKLTDGTQITAKEALEKGYISISDLDSWEIQYIREPK